MTEKIMGLDPSIAAFGWCVLELEPARVVTLGTVRTAKGTAGRHVYRADDDGIRIDTIAGVLVREARAHGVRLIAAEAPAGAQSAVAAKAMGQAYALARTVGVALGIRVITVQAHEPRTLLCGSKLASKADVEAALRELYPEAGPMLEAGRRVAAPVREGAFDALAVAHAAARGTFGALLRGH